MLASQDEVASSVQLTAKAASVVGLEVEGIGHITLPVPADQARQLRGLGRPARFGRGEETLTDPTVRDTWEIPRELVRVEWRDGLEADLEAVRDELGLPEHCRLTADFHSLLVYEQGQFFAAHQDSEKNDAMIATLVVTLPSPHTGGELVVHHLGEATTYRGLPDRVSLVAFYADCQHEVRPVTSGYRITLTYNLLLHGDLTHRVPDDAAVGALARCLDEHFSTRTRHPYRDATSEPPHRLVFLLDHEYTARSLSWPRLKGVDASRAALLRTAADAAGCETMLALAEIQETWDAQEPEPEYGYRHPGSRYQQWDDEDDDEDEDYDEDEDEDDDDEDDGANAGQADDTRYELNELIDTSVRLTRWADPAGTSAEDISLNVADTEVCTATPSADLRPYMSQYEGYMGNYGNTLDRWYRRVAVVVWPRDRGFTNRAEASPSWAMDNLLARASAGDTAPARAAAATLAPSWESLARAQEDQGSLLAKALHAAVALDDAEVARMLSRPFKVESLSGRHMEPLAELSGRHGEEWTGELLRDWFGDPRLASAFRPGPSRPQWLTSLPDLYEVLQAKGRPGAATARRLLDPAWDWLAQEIGSALASQSASRRKQHLGTLGEPLAALVRVATATQATELRDRIVDFCRQHGDAMTGCVIPALRAAAAFPVGLPQDDTFMQLAADQAARLRTRLARPVRADSDWSMNLPGGCTCELCSMLGAFLQSPARRTFEWPLAKDRRRHVHARIDAADLPVSHQTRRQGRPYTLVLAKTQVLFDREARERTQDQADLDWLQSL